MKTYYLNDLLGFQNYSLLIKRIEEGFSYFSRGLVTMPPVCHMNFKEPPGDLHIKCASIQDYPYYVVKIASVFKDNPKLNLPSLTGMMMLFNQKTGALETLFFDEGYLTHLRTAVAGAIAAKYLAPKNIEMIGIIGSGKQAAFQLKLLKEVTSCRNVLVWSLHKESLKKFQHNEGLQEFGINIAESAHEVAEKCRLIVTTTPSTTPILFSNDIQKGTHITAVGADRPGKQELDDAILLKADKVVADSRAQCFHHGETSFAIKKGLKEEQVSELGEIVAGLKKGRVSDQETTVVDLTGLGIQDLMIAETFYTYLKNLD